MSDDEKEALKNEIEGAGERMMNNRNYSEQSLAEPQVTYENQGIVAFGSSCEARFN